MEMIFGRLAMATQMLGALGRAFFSQERRQELASRMVDYVEYDALYRALTRDHVVNIRYEAGPCVLESIDPILVTTNRGLFLFSTNRWHRLFPITCFGIAKKGPDLYLGVSAGLYSFVVHGVLNETDAEYCLGRLRVLVKYETRYHNERIHQIAYDPLTDHVLCANTRRTSLLTVDPFKGGVVKEEFLFEDGTGFPVHTDQAHLNSVMPHGEAKLFAVHNAGKHRSALGFVVDGRVRAYDYPVRGVHDVLIHDDALMFTDSFRADRMDEDPDVSGAIRFRGQEYMADRIDSVRRKLVLRGLSVRDDQVIVGYSLHSRREYRMQDAFGGLLVLNDGVEPILLDGPFSQVYDIIPMDGQQTYKSGPPRTGDELHNMFERDVGPLIYDRPVPQPIKIAKLQ